MREVAVVVGGRDSLGEEYTPETWEIDPVAATWTRIDVPSTPEAVVGCQMTWSEDRAALYHFGGGSLAGGFSDRVHRYDPSMPGWVEIAATGPSARYDDAFMSLGPGRPILMYGGSQGASGAAFFSDVWLFDPMTETWSESVPAGEAGVARRTPWVVPDPGGHGFLAGFGNRGLEATDAFSDLAHYDLDAREWTDVTPASGPTARSFTQPLPGGPDAVAHMLGGYDNAGPVAEVWRLVRAE